MDSAHAQEDALGAAMKAIQSVELAAVGQAVHPRAGDMSFLSISSSSDAPSANAVRKSAFGTIDEDEKGTPKPNPYRRRRCGVAWGMPRAHHLF